MPFEDIEKDFLILKSQLEHTGKKYYHLNSIENFILHLDLIKPDSRAFVIKSLKSCSIYYQDNLIKDIRHSKEVFDRYLRPVGKIYERQAGFFVLVKPWILTGQIIIVHLIIYLANFDLMITLVSDLLILLFIFYLAIKYRSHKLYAFLW